MIYPWKLNYWKSGEWQVCNERLQDLSKAGISFNPERRVLFAPLREVKREDVRVAILGQDPYPQRLFTTGHAFSIPEGISRESFPPTLNTIFKEYVSDLGYEFPHTGSLSRWVAQGVLLWNAVPTCTTGQSLSHDWPEYTPLTTEIIRLLSDKGIVFVFVGSVAKRYLEFVDLTKNEVILTSHPSPRGTRFSKTPFQGSRLFSTINDKLVAQGLPTIDWKLDATPDKEILQGSSVDRGNVLDNITGADLGGLKGNNKPSPW